MVPRRGGRSSSSSTYDGRGYFRGDDSRDRERDYGSSSSSSSSNSSRDGYTASSPLGGNHINNSVALEPISSSSSSSFLELAEDASPATMANIQQGDSKHYKYDDDDDDDDNDDEDDGEDDDLVHA